MTTKQRTAQITKALQEQSKDARANLLKPLLNTRELCEIADATNDLLYKHFVYDYSTYFDNTFIIHDINKALLK